MNVSKMLHLSGAGENYNSVSAGELTRLPANGNVGVMLTVHTVGSDPVRVKSVSGELTDKTEGQHPRRFARVDGKSLFPGLFRELPALRAVYFETLPAAAGGYEIYSDGFFARFLPGRNVVIVTTRETRATRVLQVPEWHLLQCKLFALLLQIELEYEAHGEAGARNAGVMADDFLGI